MLKFHTALAIMLLSLYFCCSMVFAAEHETSVETGIETHYPSMNSASLLNPKYQYFEQSYRYHIYALLKNRIYFTDKISTTLKLFAEDVDDNRKEWKTNKNDKDYFNLIVNEGFVSYKASEAIFFDIGKADIKSGAGFFRNPTDLLSNPLHFARKGRISNVASASSDPYREGSLMVKADYYTPEGTLTVAYIPKIANPSDKKEVTEQSVWERVNSQNLALIKWRVASTENYNPEIVAMLGDRFGLGAGVSIEDGKAIFNVEVAVKDNAKTFVPSPDAENMIRNFQFPSTDRLFSQRNDRTFYFEGIVGIDYRSDSKYNVILEYYYNQAGLSHKEWNDYFSFLRLLNDYNSLMPFSPVFADYIGVFVEKSRINAYSSVLHGQHYLFARIAKEELFFIDLTARLICIFSLNDYSSLIDGQVEYLLTSKGWKFHLGYWTTTGGAATEFGVQMVSSGLYAGVSYLW